MTHRDNQPSPESTAKGHQKASFFTKWGIHPLLLIIVVTALWCTVYDRWDLSIPVSIDQDSGYVLAMMRLAQIGDLGLFEHIKTESLGAPFTGSLNDFPQTERAILWVGGILARMIGLYKAANIMVIGLHLLAALSFYFTARLWKVRVSVAWPLALVYSMSHQTVRSLPHLGIGYFGLLPLQLYCCWYIATAPRLRWSSNRFRLSLFIGVASGFPSIYWLIFFLQIYGLSILYRYFKIKNSIIHSVIPFLLAVTVAAALLSSFVIYQIQNGRNPAAIARSYRDTELFSLKPLDLFIPKTDQALGIFNKAYRRYITGNAITLGESETAYIGLLSSFGFVLILTGTIKRQLSGKSMPLSALGISWVLAYAGFGGMNSLLSLATNTYFIRSTNRYSAVISTIALLYFASFLHKRTRLWSNRISLALTCGITGLALVDQCYPIYRVTREACSAQIMSSRIESDRVLVTRLENVLPPQSMLFMMPVVDFPESGMINQFGDYEHLRPFRYSTQLRYSFGSNKGRPEADWQHGITSLSANDMVHSLESCGFAGILLNRRGYKDNAEELISELAATGYPVAFEQGKNREWVFIRLRPIAEPQLPTLTPQL